MPSLSLPTREEFLEQLSATPVQCCAIIDEDTACAICMREPVDTIVNDDDENAVLLHETHSFGEKCAREWLSSSNTCPKCRTVLFEEDEDDVQEEDAEMDDAAAEEMTFDEAEMAHLLWQAGQIMQRDPKTEAFDDREIMTVWFALWVQWQLALSDNNDYHAGRWATYGAASEEVSKTLDELLRVRLRWYQHSPQQLNVLVTESFDYSVEEWWKPSERDLNKRVRIDFDCGMMSTLRAGLISGGFLQAFDGENACLNAAGHPLVIDIYRRLDALLLNLEGVKLRVGSLRRKLHRELGDPDQLETRFDLPVGWPDFVRFVIDETCMMAVRRYDVHREAGAARAAAAARLDARKVARDAAGDAASTPTTPVSTCPRMSAPSTRTRE